MTPSPDNGLVLSLVAIGVFFSLAAAILGWSSARIRLAIRREETYDLDDDARECHPWFSDQGASTQARLQSVDGFVGGVHASESVAGKFGTPRGTEAKGAQTR